MKRKALFFLFLSSVIVQTECGKKYTPPIPDNPYGLPNATTTGTNIFACRANGEDWIAGKTGTAVVGAVLYDTLVASGSSGDSDHFKRLVLRINSNLIAQKTYSVGIDSTVLIWLITDVDCFGFSSNIPIQYANTGKITITKLDKTRKIVSGLFECVIPVENCDTLKISDGRFDIQYN